MVLTIIGIIFFAPAIHIINGTGGFGPERTQNVVVKRLYVDSGTKESGSHYMVGTDKGVFEVDNGILLGMWNADEIYAQMEQGKSYTIRTKGNRVVGFMFQYYPYIVEVKSND